MRGSTALALSTLLLAGAARAGSPSADDAVVVIRGSDVSVARPLTPERVRDGSAEVEIVRVEMPPPPPEPPRRAEPEREVVVVLLPAEDPEPYVAWTGAWPWWTWDPGFPPHAHRDMQQRRHFLPGLHLNSGRASLRSGLRSR